MPVAREAAIGPISIYPNIRLLCVQRACESYGGSLSKYLRALIYQDLFTHGKLAHLVDLPCVPCAKVTKHVPVTYDGIDMNMCVGCGVTNAAA